jgi:hypothetical protein
VTERQATRRNPYLGIDCPPWCAVSHAGEHPLHACLGSGGSIGEIWTRALIGACHDGPVVAVTGSGEWHDGGAHLEVNPAAAMHLAGMVEALADATPDQHRELAAAIREGAADITGTSDD